MYADEMYCQSSEMLSKPSPSLPSVPPNRFVMTFCADGDTFWVARHTTLMPFKSGKMYEGMTS